MFEDMSDLEILIRMEKNYGPLTKRLPAVYTTDAIDKMESELMSMLQRYKNERSISTPVPRVRMWIQNNVVNFLFFDRATGKRVILGEWLANEEGFYEH